MEPKERRFGDEDRATLLDLLIWRRDVRRFRPDALAAGTMERLVRIACLAPSVGLSQPWRFVQVDAPARRQAIRANFEACNADALHCQVGDRAALYARLKLAGLDHAPCQFAVFADPGTAQGHGLGRLTMPTTIDYSTVMAVHTLWLAARAEGIGLGWVSILEPRGIAAVLDVPPAWTFVGYFCMGYPVADDDVPALERGGGRAAATPTTSCCDGEGAAARHRPSPVRFEVQWPMARRPRTKWRRLSEACSRARSYRCSLRARWARISSEHPSAA